MKTKNKLITLLTLSATTATVTSIINKFIKLSAVSKNHLYNTESHCYHWKLGKIHYTKTGSGKPLLLIHDLHARSSGYEWSQLIQHLRGTYTVYTIDLLGCGRSEKPSLTYTNYLFIQLLSDFIKFEIGHRTNIVATGNSSELAIMACNYDSELFDKIMLVNPTSIASSTQIPNKYSKYFKIFLDLPIIGTLIYNIANSKKAIHTDFVERYFYNPYSVKSSYIDSYYESCHLGESPKSIFSSVNCHYTNINIISSIKKINNSLYLIGGAQMEQIESILKDYQIQNSAIEYSIIPKTKFLPQLESPLQLSKIIQIFFS